MPDSGLGPLGKTQCRSYQDPLQIAGPIGATKTALQQERAIRGVLFARDHAITASEAELAGNTREAARQWNIIFNQSFPQ